jgi:hypothetical protein
MTHSFWEDGQKRPRGDVELVSACKRGAACNKTDIPKVGTPIAFTLFAAVTSGSSTPTL